MSGELEALLRLVAEGRITAEEAAPIVAALEARAPADGRAAGARKAPPRASRGTRSRHRPNSYRPWKGMNR